MRKKFLVLPLVFWCLCFVISGCIPTDKNGFQYYYSSGAKGYDFIVGTDFNPKKTDVVIPPKYKGKPVVRISEGFRNNLKLNGDGWSTGQTDKIKSIMIPKTVTSIDAGAFRDCTSLEKITIAAKNPVYKSENNCVITKETNKLVATCGISVVPENITSVEAFSCIGAYLDNNAEDNSVLYVNNIAAGYKGLPPAIIKDGTTAIADNAFSGCKELESMVIPPSVTYIGYAAFYYCESLSSVYIPLTVTDMPYIVFNDNPNLTIFTDAKIEQWEKFSWHYSHDVVWDCSPEEFYELTQGQVI